LKQPYQHAGAEGRIKNWKAFRYQRWFFQILNALILLGVIIGGLYGWYFFLESPTILSIPFVAVTCPAIFLLMKAVVNFSKASKLIKLAYQEKDIHYYLDAQENLRVGFRDFRTVVFVALTILGIFTVLWLLWSGFQNYVSLGDSIRSIGR
jgi:hypothetical protein